MNLHETFLQWDNYFVDSIPLWKTNTVLVKTCVVVNRLWNILLFLSSEGYCNYLLLNDNYYNVCKNEGIKHNTGIIRDEAIMENVFQTQSVQLFVPVLSGIRFRRSRGMIKLSQSQLLCIVFGQLGVVMLLLKKKMLAFSQAVKSKCLWVISENENALIANSRLSIVHNHLINAYLN